MLHKSNNNLTANSNLNDTFSGCRVGYTFLQGQLGQVLSVLQPSPSSSYYYYYCYLFIYLFYWQYELKIHFAVLSIRMVFYSAWFEGLIATSSVSRCSQTLDVARYQIIWWPHKKENAIWSFWSSVARMSFGLESPSLKFSWLKYDN